MKTILRWIILIAFYANGAFAQSLIAYYPFSGDANDASGNGYHGTLYGNATANDTLEIGDNNSDYVSLPFDILNGLEDFTITFFVKFNSLHLIGDFPANTILNV